MLKKGILLVFLLFCSSMKLYTHATHGEETHEIGTLAGDVQNWAMLIQNYILQVRLDLQNVILDTFNLETANV